MNARVKVIICKFGAHKMNENGQLPNYIVLEKNQSYAYVLVQLYLLYLDAD